MHTITDIWARVRQSHYFFRQKLNFSERSQQPKMKKKNFLYLWNDKKWNSFRPPRWSVRNPGFSLIIIGWSELGKAILQVSIAVFWGAIEIFFGKRWLSPLEKLAPTPMHTMIAEVVIEHLKEWKAVPGICWLHLQQSIHVDRKQRPECLGMLHHSVTKPSKCLHHTIHNQTTASI